MSKNLFWCIYLVSNKKSLKKRFMLFVFLRIIFIRRWPKAWKCWYIVHSNRNNIPKHVVLYTENNYTCKTCKAATIMRTKKNSCVLLTEQQGVYCDNKTGLKHQYIVQKHDLSLKRIKQMVMTDGQIFLEDDWNASIR